MSRIRNLTLAQNILGNKRNCGKQSRSSDRKRRVKCSHNSAAAPGTPGILLEQNKPPPFTGCQLFHGKKKNKPWEKPLLSRGLQICSFLSLRESSPHSAVAKKKMESWLLFYTRNSADNEILVHGSRVEVASGHHLVQAPAQTGSPWAHAQHWGWVALEDLQGGKLHEQLVPVLSSLSQWKRVIKSWNC